MNMALIMTAVKHGAVVANYTELTNLQKDGNGKIVGAEVVDNMTGEKFSVKAKVLELHFARQCTLTDG